MHAGSILSTVLQVQGYLSAMGVLSKVSMLLFTACFMQIPFREHVLVQGIQVGGLWITSSSLSFLGASSPAFLLLDAVI